jgi:hypothetical protein
MNKIKIVYQKYWHYIILVVFSVIFFISASSYNFIVQKPSFGWPPGMEFIKWSSPDETANYVFSKLYAQEKKLYFFEKYGQSAKDIIRPRSFRSDNGFIKPVSFLGMPLLYGSIASKFSYEVIPYLTPFFGAIGIIFYYLLIRKIFGQKTAFISAMLLVFFPVYFYYCARSMFHNIPFITFLVMALYFGIKMAERKKPPQKHTPTFNSWKNYLRLDLKATDWMALFYSSLFGMTLGVSLSMRTSEVLWVFPILLILWIANIRKLGIIKPIIAVSMMLLSFLPVFYWNQILFGAPLNGGYPEMNRSIFDLTQAGSSIARSSISGNIKNIANNFKMISSTIFHFGINYNQSSLIFRSYFIKMFYWIFWPAVLGLILFLLKFRKLKKRHWLYLVSFLASSIILFLYYGSWEFYDNPDKSEKTIGNSYTRYWLPIYLGAIPFAALFFLAISRILKNSAFFRVIFLSIIILSTYLVSINFLLYGSSEGLVASANKNMATRDEYIKILGLTESNSVIITRYHDKLFFPERKVIVGEFDDPNMIKEYGKLASALPVYYYNFSLPDKSLDYLNSSRFKKEGLKIKKILQISNDFTLYKLYR